MQSKYGVAKAAIEYAAEAAQANTLDCADVHEALLVSLIQTLKESKGASYLVPLLRYEIDVLDSSGQFDIARGGGHS